MSKHRRHSHTSGGVRYTKTESSAGRITNSISTKAGNIRLTKSFDNRGHSYTTQTIQYGNGWYETKRLNTPTRLKGSPAQPVYEYSWQRDRERRAQPYSDTATTILGYIILGFICIGLLVLLGHGVIYMFSSLF